MSNLRFTIMLVISFVVFIGVGLTAIQNPATVKLNLLTFQPTVALSLLILAVALLGAVVTLVLGWGRELSHRATIASLRQELAEQASRPVGPDRTRVAA